MNDLFNNQLKNFSSYKKNSQNFLSFNDKQLDIQKNKISFVKNKDILNLSKANRNLFQSHVQDKGLLYSFGVLKISNRLFSSGLSLNNQIKRGSSFDNKNLIPLRPGLANKGSNEENLSRVSTNTFSRKVKLTEKDWKEMWFRKFNKLLYLSKYSSDSSDKLLFAYLNEKKQYLKSKYTFNENISRSQLISYNFNKKIKKIDLNSLYKILKSFFKNLESLISIPNLDISPEKVKIRLFYYVLPSMTKKIIHKSLHRYIRSDEKLYKELILRKNFKSIMDKFKIKLFIAKWKEDNYLIDTPSSISSFKEFSIYPFNQTDSIKENSGISIKNTKENFLQLQPLVVLRSSYAYEEINKNKSYENMTSLDIFKLDLFKLTQQHALLKSFFGLMSANKISEISLIQSKSHSYLTSLRNSLDKTKSDNSLQEELSSKDSLHLIKLIKKGEEDSDTSPKGSLDQLDNNSSAIDLSNKELIVISKDKSIEVLEKDIVGSNYQQENLSESDYLIKSVAQDSLTNLTDRKVSTIVSLNKVKFKYLIYILEKLFKKTVILELVRLKYPYHESNILAEILGLSSKSKNFRKLMIRLLYTATLSNPNNKILQKNIPILPSYLSGLKVRLAGRLMTQRIVPRFTIQSFQIGSLARGKINFMNSSRITLKNKRGAFSFTVTTSHIFDK